MRAREAGIRVERDSNRQMQKEKERERESRGGEGAERQTVITLEL